MKSMVLRAEKELAELLKKVPRVLVKSVEFEPKLTDHVADLRVHLEVQNRQHVLVCEVKSNGQPRNIRMAILQLRFSIKNFENATPVVIAPYLSSELQELCRESGISYFDFFGNTLLAFDGIYIERKTPGRPRAERRELRSLFKPKSAQVLRVMLRKPSRTWRVTELAKEALVSVGHVSNVLTVLVSREWSQRSSDGQFLSNPDELLDAWQREYHPIVGKRIGFYSTLHGLAFEQAARQALGLNNGSVIFGSFSSAQWLAPYSRTGSEYFYADSNGLERLKHHLKLSDVLKGENVVVTLPKDNGLFMDSIEPIKGVFCTSLVQTYLDLTTAGERGREAAEFLRREKLSWMT